MRVIALLVFMSFCISSAYGQRRAITKGKIAGFEYSETELGYSDVDELPLIIAFHYSSGKPYETIDDYNVLKIPARIIVPKGNYQKREGFSYYPVDYYQKDSLTQFALAKATVDSLARFVDSIETKYKKKAIVTGISQGGDIAFMLAVYYPQLCRAAFPLAAVIHSATIDEVIAKSVKKVPIFLFQGEADPIVTLVNTKIKVTKIGDRLILKLYTYPNLGHEISSQMKMDYSSMMDELNKKSY